MASNVRAAALSVLGRNEEATQVSLSALAAEPENAFGHTEHGWLMLRQARYDEALVSFRQALRLSPTYERARLGIIEALKARNGIYRLFLRYTLWMNSFEGRTQWFILLGLAFGSRIIRTVSRESPALAPVLLPLLALYTLFAIGTWLAAPLSNLLLRINPFGRLILSKPEVTSSNLVAACLATALAGGLLYLATSHVGWAAVGGTAALMVMPISGAFSLHGSRGWRVASIVAAILALLGAATIVLAFIGSEAAVVPVAAMLVGVLLNQWVLNYFAIKYQ